MTRLALSLFVPLITLAAPCRAVVMLFPDKLPALEQAKEQAGELAAIPVPVATATIAWAGVEVVEAISAVQAYQLAEKFYRTPGRILLSSLLKPGPALSTLDWALRMFEEAPATTLWLFNRPLSEDAATKEKLARLKEQGVRVISFQYPQDTFPVKIIEAENRGSAYQIFFSSRNPEMRYWNLRTSDPSRFLREMNEMAADMQGLSEIVLDNRWPANDNPSEPMWATLEKLRLANVKIYLLLYPEPVEQDRDWRDSSNKKPMQPGEFRADSFRGFSSRPHRGDTVTGVDSDSGETRDFQITGESKKYYTVTNPSTGETHTVRKKKKNRE